MPYMKIASYSVVSMFIIFIFTSSICIMGESTRSDDVVTFSYLLKGSTGEYVEETTDGGYVIVGLSEEDNIALTKTNNAGYVEWQKVLKTDRFEHGYSVQQSSDGGYVIVGKTTQITRLDDIIFIKVDANGNKTYEKTFGGAKYDIGHHIQQTTDSGYVIVGETQSFGTGDVNPWGDTNSDVWVIKIDSSGNVQWNKTYGGNHSQIGHTIEETSDGGYIIVGTSGIGVYLLKIDTDGNEIWRKIFENEHVNSGARDVKETSDGGFIIGGYTDSYLYSSGSYDGWLIKTDSSGEEIWNRTYGMEGGEYINAVCLDSTGGYIFTGYTSSSDRINDNVWIVKTDSNGIEIWNLDFGGDKEERAYSVQETNDGGYIVVGHTISYRTEGNDVWLLKVDTEGKISGSEVPTVAPYVNGDQPNGGSNGDNGDLDSDPPSKLPWLWIAIGAGAVILIAIIIIIIRRRNDDEWDDEDDEYDDDEDDEDEDEEEDKVRRKPSKPPQKRCIKCSAVLISPDAAFCAACGSSQAAVSAPAPSPQLINCPGCGGVNPQGTAFCGMCGMNLQRSLGTAAAAPMVQQVPVMQQPARNQFIQQPQTQAPVQPMAQQGYVQQQPVPASASMFPPQQQQNPPAPPPPVPPGYGGLQ